MANLSRKGVDFSYDPPMGAELQAAGITAAMVYITDPDPAAGNKGITQARWDDLGRHGVAMGLVWELGNAAVLAGFDQGVADAKNAQANLNALRGPANRRPIYFAIDFDIQPGQYAKAEAYFHGVATVIGLSRTGAYGHDAILDHLTGRGVITFRWQTYAWSKGVRDASNHVLQYDNGQALGAATVDLCLMLPAGNWGQKTVLLAKPAPKPVKAAAKPDPHVVVTVKSGQTLSGIAEAHNTSLAQVERINPQIKDFDRIYPGAKVRVK
jgi:LysM repeat protein